MSIRKYASVDLKVYKPHVLQTAGAAKGSFARFGSFSFQPRPGYVYSRVRAISARINKNFDGFPSVELEKAASTFNGRPVFINHNNQDPERTRGVILASQYHGLSDDPHITILPEVDALTFPNLARDIVNGNMDSVSMGCDVDNSTCSYCGNVAKTAEEFCDHILNNKGQELTKLVNGQPKRILVFEICRGLNFFEISFVFDPADETAVMQEVIVPDGVKMGSNNYVNDTYWTTSGGGITVQPEMSRTASTGSGLNVHLSYGEMIAPPKVDTLRDDNDCPQCGSDFNGIECDNCGYITPPEELQDPDTEKAGSIRDDEDDDSDEDNPDLDYFGDDDDSDEEDEESEDDEDDEPNPYDLYNGQPRKEGSVTRGTAVQANVGQALAQRRLAEAQRRLRALGDYDNDASVSSDPTPMGSYPLGAEGTDTGENIASPPSAPEAPAFGGGPAEASPDKSTTVEALDDNEPGGSFGDRQPVQQVVTSRTRQTRKAEDLSNESVARPDDRENVEAPVANMVDNTEGGGTDSQYSESGWDDNAAENSAFDNEHTDETSTVVPDGSGRTPMQTGASVVLKKASASQVYQLADLYNELGLVPLEHRYAAIAEMEKAPAMLVEDRIKLLKHVASVFADRFAAQMPQGRVARTAGSIPVLGKTASARTPSMARQAENRRLASSAEDTLLLF
ncbi:MAG TPA: zinc ribbon domain-containing protein [Candidatus Paceibacterota bacterium]